MTACQETSCNR